MRARIDVSEIEAQTKIRAKYLRALENEEWSLLPGPTFVKSFLRTYAQALGLDGRALVEEYRLHHERANEAFEPIVATGGRARGHSRGQRSGPSRGYVLAVALTGGLILVLIVLLALGGSGGSSKKPASHTTRAAAPATSPQHAGAASGSASTLPRIVALSLQASSTVYVCLIGDHGRKLVPGLELAAGESTPTFHARRYELTLGNNAVTLLIDGRARTVPPSSGPIGYAITHARGRQQLTGAQLPTCR